MKRKKRDRKEKPKTEEVATEEKAGSEPRKHKKQVCLMSKHNCNGEIEKEGDLGSKVN